MCCNGVLFHMVRLQPMDSVRDLEALGMKINRKKKEPYFAQPCRFLQDCGCTIYPHRPQRCRLYVCRQIEALMEEEVSEQEALVKVSAVLSVVNRIKDRLKKVVLDDPRRPLEERCRDALAGEDTDVLDKTALASELAELNRSLDRHFRKAVPG